MQRALWVQGSLLLLCAIASLVLADQSHGISTAWGGLIAMVNSLLLARAVHKASRAALKSGKAAMAHLYVGFVARFFIVLAGMGIGVIRWQLPVLPMIVGLGVVSLGAAVVERIK